MRLPWDRHMTPINRPQKQMKDAERAVKRKRHLQLRPPAASHSWFFFSETQLSLLPSLFGFPSMPSTRLCRRVERGRIDGVVAEEKTSVECPLVTRGLKCPVAVR